MYGIISKKKLYLPFFNHDVTNKFEIYFTVIRYYLYCTMPFCKTSPVCENRKAGHTKYNG